MKETLNELILYIKNPVLEKDKNTDLKYRFRKLSSIFVISLLTSFFFTILISILEENGFINSENHSVTDVFNEYGPVFFFIFAVIVAPLIEESIFRAPLTLFKKKKTFKIAFYVFALAFGFLHITNYEISTNVLIFSPILIAPQIFAGLYFGFVRIRFGLIWSIALHATYNALIFSLFLLTKDAIT